MAGERIHHPRPAELEAFLLGQLPSREAARVVAHLLTGCPSCRKRMEPLAGVVLTPNRIPGEADELGSQYDFPLFRAFSAARRYAASLAQERREVEGDRSGRLAQRRCRQLELGVSLGRMNTGDGFYLWNRRGGAEAGSRDQARCGVGELEPPLLDIDHLGH